ARPHLLALAAGRGRKPQARRAGAGPDGARVARVPPERRGRLPRARRAVPRSDRRARRLREQGRDRGARARERPSAARERRGAHSVFVAFEGIGGAGKTTQAELLKEALEAEG